MHWLNRRKNREGEHSKAELRAVFADHKKDLYWLALFITGKPELAERSVVDAATFDETSSYTFRVWLLHWARSATARAAVNAVRSSIHKTAAQYADWTCSHRKHEPLSPAETETLHQLDAYRLIERLDVSARAVLVLYGCEGASFPECALALGVPLSCVIGAYCRALRTYSAYADAINEFSHADVSELRFVHHDPDGIPVWSSDPPRLLA